MAREFKPTKQITQVVYFTDGPNPTRKSATFIGHLSQSEIERTMLFSKHVPKRLIAGSEHKFN